MYFSQDEQVLVRTEKTILTDKRLILIFGEHDKRVTVNIKLSSIIEISYNEKAKNPMITIYQSNGRYQQFHGGKKTDLFIKYLIEYTMIG